MHCHLGSLGRGGCFVALLRCLLLLADGGSLADALPPYFGGCFATVIVLLSGCFATYGYFVLGGCFAAIPLGFAAMVVLFGGCFATISCFVLATVFCTGPALRVAFCLGGLFGVFSPSVFLLLSVAVCEFVCIFSSVFLFC